MGTLKIVPQTKIFDKRKIRRLVLLNEYSFRPTVGEGALRKWYGEPLVHLGVGVQGVSIPLGG